MKNFLEEIVRQRRQQLSSVPRVAGHRARAKTPHRFRAALLDERVNIIGEFKRASPSRGLIRGDAQPAETVTLYQRAGACAISILTEPDYFRGSIADLRIARQVTALPILRKDFIVDESQIDEAAAAGADAILLIVAALADNELVRLRLIAEENLGLDALIEVHTAEEMQRATDAGGTLIGVNNRDLRSLKTSLKTSEKLAGFAPAGSILVSESGLSSSDEIDRLRQYGYRGFLIGESLMRTADPFALIHSLRGVAMKEASGV